MIDAQEKSKSVGLLVKLVNAHTRGKFQTFDLDDYRSRDALQAAVGIAKDAWSKVKPDVTIVAVTVPKFAA